MVAAPSTIIRYSTMHVVWRRIESCSRTKPYPHHISPLHCLRMAPEDQMSFASCKCGHRGEHILELAARHSCSAIAIARAGPWLAIATGGAGGTCQHPQCDRRRPTSFTRFRRCCRS